MIGSGYSCQYEKELEMKLRDAEASIHKKWKLRYLYPWHPLILLFMTSVHSHYMHTNPQFVCVHITYVCLHRSIYDWRLHNFYKDILPFRNVCLCIMSHTLKICILVNVIVIFMFCYFIYSLLKYENEGGYYVRQWLY